MIPRDRLKQRGRCAAARAFTSAGSAALAFCFGMHVARAEPLGRNDVDRREVDIMRQGHPRALELLEQGERALQAGRLEEAEARFEEARQEDPRRALPARRRCQVLAALGRESEAKHACTLALAAVGSPLDLRAMVSAWLSKPRLLTPAELDRVTDMAARAARLSSGQPWGLAAECDIARRIGDRLMLKECVAELSQLAPSHYETRRAHDAAASFGTPWVRVVGWIALALACLATVLRAALPKSRSRPIASVGSAGAGALFVLLAGLSWSEPARADAEAEVDRAATAADLDAPSRPLGQLSTQFPIDVNNPMAGIPSIEQRNKSPVQFGYWLMDMSVLADNALKKSDYANAAKYFEAIVAAVPDRGVGYSKLCKAYVEGNNREKAVRPCRTALGHEGATVDDHLRYARLLISKPGKLGAQEISDIDAQVKHLLDKKLEAPAHRIACELAVRLDDEKRLESCTAGLTKLEPDELGTVSFQWALAIRKGQFEQADNLIVRARELGMSDEGVAKMQAGAQEMKPLWRYAIENMRYVLGGSLFVVAVSILLVTWLRTRPRQMAQNA
jgi:tetratricopeptide (TPR) repeat protein